MNAKLIIKPISFLFVFILVLVCSISESLSIVVTPPEPYHSSYTCIYDEHDRLIEMRFNDDTFIQYSYDAVGNRTQEFHHVSGFYAITVSAGQGGSVSPASIDVLAGESPMFVITADEGWHVEDVLVDGSSVGAVYSYGFVEVRESHSLQVRFGIDGYEITSSVAGGGQVIPSSATIDYGGSQVFAITPDVGYHIAGVTMDGNSVGPVSSYTFTEVTATHILKVSFEINTYSIATSAIGCGTISPSSATVNYGSSRAFTISPGDGNSIIGVWADGVSQGPIGSFTFSNVTGNHSLAATFTKNGSVKNVSSGVTYSSIQDAYNASADGDTILVQAVVFQEDLAADRNISVIIDGGYEGAFGSNSGRTIMKGSSHIASGTVQLKNFEIAK